MNKEHKTAEFKRRGIKKGIVITLLLSLLFFVLHITHKTITDLNDVTAINGIIQDYSFKTFSSYGRSDLKDYTIRLEGVDRKFQIRPDQIWLFKKLDFEQKVRKGDPIKLNIPKKIETSNVEEQIPIVGITVKNNNYLNPREVIRENKSPLLLIYSVLFFFSSVTLSILLMVKTKSARLQPTSHIRNCGHSA